MDVSLAPERKALEDVLEFVRGTGKAPSQALVAKLVELARLVYVGAKPSDWEDLAIRLCEATGMDEAALEAAVGAEASGIVVVDTPPVDEPDESTHMPFEPLVDSGWLKDYLDYTADSEAPAQYHFASAITTAAACLGRRPLIGWRVMPTFPNLYTFIIGPTGARKSTAVRLATNLLRESMPEGVLNTLPNEGSPQGYAKWLRKRQYETNKAADGLIVASELTVMLGKGKYQEELGKWLTDWYDSEDRWARALSSDEFYEIYNLYVNFLGASNMTWLRDLPQSVVRGGLLPRTFIVDAAGKRHRRAMPKYDDALRTKLIGQATSRLTDVADVMALDPRTEKLVTAWYNGPLAIQEESSADDMFQAWVSRKQACALKIATVWQYLDGGPKGVLLPEYFERAQRVVDWSDGSVRRVYAALGVSEAGEAQQAIVDLLLRSPGNELSQSKIVRSLRNRWSAARVLDGLKTLQMSREIRSQTSPTKGTSWILVRR